MHVFYSIHIIPYAHTYELKRVDQVVLRLEHIFICTSTYQWEEWI